MKINELFINLNLSFYKKTLSSFLRKYDVKSAFTLMLEQNFSYKIYCFCDDNLIVCKQSSTVQSNIGSIQMKRS